MAETFYNTPSHQPDEYSHHPKLNNNLYVVTPIYNPHEFKSRYLLYEQFARRMEFSGAKLFTVEAAFDGQPFRVTTHNNPMNLQLRTNSVLWHKERMINLGVHRLAQIVPDFRYFGWFDADVNLLNYEWVSDTVLKLMHHKVVQPFGEAINLDADGYMMWKCPSTFRSFIEGRGYHQEPPLPWNYIYKGHPGLAWAAQRDWFEKMGGLYDTCVSGSADTVMANALKGKWDIFLPAPPSDGMRISMAKYQARCDQFVKGNVGYVPGTIVHYWHGASSDRGYEKRWSILNFHKFDEREDLIIDGSGLYAWSGNKPRLEDDIRMSLAARKEDAR